jgi:hypothetical protein
MKKTIKIIMLSLSTVIMIYSCSKSETGSINNTGNNGQGSAQWTFDGVASSSDSSFASISNNRIMAYKDVLTVQSKIFNLNLSSLSVGNYVLSSTMPNVLIYRISTTVDHTSQSGTVNITSNTGTKLSGNYSAQMENGLTLTGTFSEVPIRQ